MCSPDGRQQISQAVVLLGARRAAGQVLTHPGHPHVSVLAGKLTVDIDVEQVKTFLAGELGARGAEQRGDEVRVRCGGARS